MLTCRTKQKMPFFEEMKRRLKMLRMSLHHRSMKYVLLVVYNLQTQTVHPRDHYLALSRARKFRNRKRIKQMCRKYSRKYVCLCSFFGSTSPRNFRIEGKLGEFILIHLLRKAEYAEPNPSSGPMYQNVYMAYFG